MESTSTARLRTSIGVRARACGRAGVPMALTRHRVPPAVRSGQLLLNSLEFALEVWASRPAVFKNGAVSQQGYANAIKGNYSHSGLPLAFFNHCWKAHRVHAACACCVHNCMPCVQQTAPGSTPAPTSHDRPCRPWPQYTRMVDGCGLTTYHATCEMVAKSKRLSMNASVAAANRRGCAISASDTLPPVQLSAFTGRLVQPTRLSAIRVGG